MSVIIIPKSILRIVVDLNSKKLESKRIQQSSSAKELDIQYPIADKVIRHSILVKEFDSDNGYALIKCQAKSKRTGEYAYIYYNREHKKVEYTITSLSLFDEGDEEIKVDAFLTC